MAYLPLGTDRIGRGSFANVYAAQDTRTGEKVALKQLLGAFDSAEDRRHALREIHILRRVEHKNLVELRDAFTFVHSKGSWQRSVLYLVMPYIGQTLDQAMQSNEEITSYQQRRFLIFQILCGVEYLHSKSIIHRDLKPDNVLIKENTQNGRLTVKIADFNLSRYNYNDNSSHTRIEPNGYRAPEILFGLDYDEKVDIWPIGCMMASILTKFLENQIAVPQKFWCSRGDVELARRLVMWFGKPGPLMANRMCGRWKEQIRELSDVPPVFSELFEGQIDYSEIAVLENMLHMHAPVRSTAPNILEMQYFECLRTFRRVPSRNEIDDVDEDIEKLDDQQVSEAIDRHLRRFDSDRGMPAFFQSADDIQFSA
ncbi:unnamed protein product [Caenorhabditis auriculariae]|uniref:Protein kinase domain-containing protein n=1 Tax=Caenorhabditis auriculariae TaxID=2777116 RepID=A0A8S1HSR3_9PELO|nr:unnamed protein product [Caenorhabditis auriculariae]